MKSTPDVRRGGLLPSSLWVRLSRCGIGMPRSDLLWSLLFLPGLSDSASRSRGSGSAKVGVPPGVCGPMSGLVVGDTSGDVWRASGMLLLVSKTKKASPPSPSFMGKSLLTPLTVNSTRFSEGRSNENLPKRTWKGEQAREPSSCSTTMTSIAPLRVAGLIEFQVFETEPEMERTYCISAQAEA